MRVSIKEDLLKIKDIIKKPGKSRSYIEEADQILFQLRDLNAKADRILENIQGMRNSPVRLKRKKQIISIIKDRNRVSASELANLLKLSRTRCTEYLVELEREGIVQGVTDRRIKYYMLSL